MGFSRCTPFTIRCATKTGAPTNIIKPTTLRVSTSTRENITCDFPLFLMDLLTKVFFLDWGEKLRPIVIILFSHKKQSLSVLEVVMNDLELIANFFPS